MASSKSATSQGVASIDENEPKSHLMPTSESSERTPSVIVAERSHERSTSTTSATLSANTSE